MGLFGQRIQSAIEQKEVTGSKTTNTGDEPIQQTPADCSLVGVRACAVSPSAKRLSRKPLASHSLRHWDEGKRTDREEDDSHADKLSGVGLGVRNWPDNQRNLRRFSKTEETSVGGSSTEVPFHPGGVHSPGGEVFSPLKPRSTL